MTSEGQMPVLVFKDGAGDYFLVPQELLERGRVPGEHAEQIERLLADADSDVSGYVASITYSFLRVLNMGANAMGDLVGEAANAAYPLQLEIISVEPVR
jgi:hypothetical protein